MMGIGDAGDEAHRLLTVVLNSYKFIKKLMTYHTYNTIYKIPFVYTVTTLKGMLGISVCIKYILVLSSESLIST